MLTPTEARTLARAARILERHTLQGRDALTSPDAVRGYLRTRLAWGLVYELVPLGDEDKALHLKAVAASRGLQLSNDIVEYLLTRLPRDMRSLQSIMEVLDQYSLMRKRPLTLPLVREALAQEILARQPQER